MHSFIYQVLEFISSVTPLQKSTTLLQQQQSEALAIVERQCEESLAVAAQYGGSRKDALLVKRAKNREYQRAYRARRKAEDKLQLQLEGELPEVNILPPSVDNILFSGNEGRDVEDAVGGDIEETKETEDADDILAIPLLHGIAHGVEELKENEATQGGYNTVVPNE